MCVSEALQNLLESACQHESAFFWTVTSIVAGEAAKAVLGCMSICVSYCL